MAFQSNYWSCSRFADWLRGTPKLQAGTGKEWRLWREAAKETHPIRYWIVEEGLDHLQDFVTWPARKLNDIRYYVNNRWISRAHALTAHPRDIKPGAWCDVGNRFLPCLFNELVDFVEVETAWHHVLWDKEAREKYKTPWWRSGWLRWRTWRCPEAGIAHLKWAMTLTNRDFIQPGEEEEPTLQAENAREILVLYTWFTEVYRNRPDPMDVSGWSAYCEARRSAGKDFFDLEDRTPEEEDASQTALKISQEIETAYDLEDEEMMIRLIRVRQALWT